jgi:D-3-phosphoglycerate dehydrogenase / 2-oxoglutarate reductase
VAILGTRFGDFDVEREVLGDVDLVSGPGQTVEDVLEVAAGADVILAGAAPRFDAGTLEKLESRAIVRLGVGVDGVDLESARSLGMWVVNVPDYGMNAVALHAVTLILASLRRLTTADRRLREGTWGVADLRPLRLPSSLTAGVIGFGRIGRRVAVLLAGLGFGTVLVSDPAVEPSDVTTALGGAPGGLVILNDLLVDSDVVTLHSPPPATGYLLGASELGTMKEGSILVNTARGSLIDTGALVEALGHNRPGFAALDVFEHEPPDVSVFETVAERMIMTPHMSWYTEESELALRRQAAAEARRILDSERPLHAVVAPASAEIG